MARTPYQSCGNGVGFMGTYYAETAKQTEPGSSHSQLQALRRFGQNIGVFSVTMPPESLADATPLFGEILLAPAVNTSATSMICNREPDAI